MFNEFSQELIFTINNQEYKIPASGMNEAMPIDLDPGKYTFTISIPGGAVNGEVEIGPNQSWAIGVRNDGAVYEPFQVDPAIITSEYQFTPTNLQASKNKDLVHFSGTIRDKAGNPVNGFSILLDNGTFEVLSHPSGPSNHYPDREDGEWDVVIPNVEDGIGQWTLTVVSYDCPDFAAVFDAQCKQYTRLSADIPVEVTYPEETIINADWVCHWDCDKGLYSQPFR